MNKDKIKQDDNFGEISSSKQAIGIASDEEIFHEDNKNDDYAEEDERFKKKIGHATKDHQNIKTRISKERSKSNRKNFLYKFKKFLSGDMDSEGFTIQKMISFFSICSIYLLNLFTIVVMVYLIIDLVLLFRQEMQHYLQAVKIILEGALIWIVVKIHEKIEV